MFYILMVYNTLLHMTGFIDQVTFDHNEDFCYFGVIGPY